MAAQDLGRCFSCDEQMIGFKGNHADKQCISYKKEGDVFLADAISQDGYTNSFFFWNMPAPKKYLDQKLSPLYSRCLFLFEQFKEKQHMGGVDNLYTSAKFLSEAYKGKNKVMLLGITRKSCHGVPKSILQEEIKNVKWQMRVRGTTMAAVLEGNSECPNLVALSVYDMKPVHFLCMACTGLKWIEK